MKKLVTVLLIIEIVFNVFLPKKILAYTDTSKSSLGDMTMDYDTFSESSESGTADVGNNGKKSFVATDSTVTSVSNTLIKFLNIIPTLASGIMSIVAYDDSATEINDKYGKWFSIEKLVFNKVGLFNINFFDGTTEGIRGGLTKYIGSFFVVIRNVSIVIDLLILLYIGIRLAIATVSEKKAQYKRSLMDWFFSFVILMCIQLLMVLLLHISNALLDILENVYESVTSSYGLENSIINQALNSNEQGFKILIASIVYWILTFYQLKFFWMYSKRLFSVGFLIVMAPIVISSYSIDKAKDGQAQALSNWLKEYLLNVFIQPLHALLYIVFIVTASNLATVAPLLTVIFLAALSRGEQVIRELFKIQDAASITSMKNSAINYSNLKHLGKVGANG